MSNLTEILLHHFKIKSNIETILKTDVIKEMIDTKSISLFDISLKNSGLLEFKRYNNWEKFIEFQHFLYTIRQAILKCLNIKEQVLYAEKQKRILCPRIEAFIKTANNNFDIKESLNRYDLIFE